MNPKLPAVSGREAVSRFEKIGYRKVRQRGSHMRLLHGTDDSHKPLTIPDHKTLGKGLLRKLLRDAHVTAEDFLRL